MKYLALKGTDENLRSAFVGFKLARQYKVGATMKAPKGFPFYLIDKYPATTWECDTGCDNYIKKFILLEVEDKYLADEAPFTSTLAKYNEEHACVKRYWRMPFNLLLKNVSGRKSKLVTRKLKVLGEIDTSRFFGAGDAMNFFEKFYGLKRVTFDCVK